MAIKSTQLDSTATTIYTSSGNSAVTVVYFCNVTPTPLAINFYAVPAGQQADVGNMIYHAVQIAPSDTFVVDTERLVLDANDYLVANVVSASPVSIGNTVVSTISYMDI